MKAVYCRRYGPPDVLELREVPRPVPGDADVLIRVVSTTVSAGDWRVRAGAFPAGFGLLARLALGMRGPRKPVLGTELSGVVEAVGKDVGNSPKGPADGGNFAPGDFVFAFPGARMGAHAEYVIMPAAGRVERMPEGMSFDDAAALSFGGTTALDFLRRGDVKAGERVLVLGASGCVGSAVVQLAKARGAHVTAVCSGGNAELVRGLGADDVIDYQTRDVLAGDARFDVAVDCVGSARPAAVARVLAPGGRLLLVIASLADTILAPLMLRGRGVRVVAGPSAESKEDLATLRALAQEGRFRPLVDARFPLTHIAEAHARVETGRKRGSVIVRVSEPPR